MLVKKLSCQAGEIKKGKQQQQLTVFLLLTPSKELPHFDLLSVQTLFALHLKNIPLLYSILANKGIYEFIYSTAVIPIPEYALTR